MKSQREVILGTLQASGYIYFDDKRLLGKWIGTLKALEVEGLITMRLVQVDEQSARLEVRRAVRVIH